MPLLCCCLYICRLVYFESYRYVRNAIARETERKGWTRAQKIQLIEQANPTWNDRMPPKPVAAVQTFQTAGSLRD